MRDFKKFTSTKVRKELEKNGFDELIEKFRLGYDNPKKQVFKFWMDRFDDLLIKNEETLKTKINYIHNNPVKAGLVEEPGDWKYSSYRNYYSGDHSVIYVNTEWNFDFEAVRT